VAQPKGQEVVNFTGLLSEGTGVMTFTWDFGDGSAPVNGQQMSHAWLYNGDYTVRLTATGAPCPKNRSQTITSTVTVVGAIPTYLPLIAGPTSAVRAADRPGLAPGQVSALAGVEDADGLRLAWDAPPDGGRVASYRVYAAGYDGDFAPVGVTSGNRTNFVLAGGACGQAIAVAAVGPGGEGPLSRHTFFTLPCVAQGGDR